MLETLSIARHVEAPCIIYRVVQHEKWNSDLTSYWPYPLQMRSFKFFHLHKEREQ